MFAVKPRPQTACLAAEYPAITWAMNTVDGDTASKWAVLYLATFGHYQDHFDMFCTDLDIKMKIAVRSVAISVIMAVNGSL